MRVALFCGDGEGILLVGGGALLGREVSVGEEGKSPSGGRECPSGGGKCPSGKSVSPVSALGGYLGGVVGESAAKRGYESPAPLQGIACGGHSGDSDLHEAEMA